MVSVTLEAMLAETIGIAGYDSDMIDAYYARPLTVTPAPSVLVLHHMPGWDDWTREATRKLAAQGYATLAPHLFHRLGPGTWQELAAKNRAVRGPADAQALGDIQGAARFLLGQPTSNGKLGVMGMSIGGRLAFLAAARVPCVSAAINCWGGGVTPRPDQLTPDKPEAVIDMLAGCQVPLMGLFGNDDTGPTAGQVNELEDRLKAAGADYVFHRYEGAEHDIFCTDKPGYRVELAPDVWDKVFAFWETHLS
jgi:carboxymethylenebutenolidase